MKNNKLTILFSLAFALFVLCIISVVSGNFSLSINEIIEILNGNLENTVESRVFFGLRVPRTIMAVVSGLGLGVSGYVYQTIFKNLLASPDLTGVSAGACFGVALGIILGITSPFLLIGISFLGGVASLFFVVMIVRITGVNNINNFLFAGIIIKALFDAGLMIIKTLADSEGQIATIEFWLMGSLSTITNEKIFMPIIGAVFSLILLVSFSPQITMLSLGDVNAKSTGLNVDFWRVNLLAITTFLISSIVSVIGTVAFVGLIAPHVAIMLIKRRGIFHLISSGLIGGIFVVLSDLIARGKELPLSIPIVIISVPFLGFLIFKAKGDVYD